jgi:microcompartment protein CcmK/EutM
MILARVVGTVVATRKDPRLEGKKLLIVKPVAPDGKDEAGYVVSVDTVGAGFRERVIVVAGVPLGTPGATNMLRIAFVGAEAGRGYEDR